MTADLFRSCMPGKKRVLGFPGHNTKFVLTASQVIYYASSMARISRLVVPGYPHHETQRGVRSIPIFNSDTASQLRQARTLIEGAS
jgi:hypothetical protein